LSAEVNKLAHYSRIHCKGIFFRQVIIKTIYMKMEELKLTLNLRSESRAPNSYNDDGCQFEQGVRIIR